MNDLLNVAIALVNEKFADKYDRSGQPAIMHPLRVMMMSSDVDGRVVGILHDIIEDTDITADHLLARGFPERIVLAVDAVSRREYETYAEFIERIARSGKLAVRVKLNDLADNLERVRELPEGEGLAKRYNKAKKRLLQAWED